MSEKKVNLLGLDILDADLVGAVGTLKKRMEVKGRTVVFTPNTEMLAAAVVNDGIARLLSFADVLLPDGFGLRVAGLLSGVELKNTTAGIEVGEQMLCLAEKRGYRVFLLGGKEGVARAAARKLKKRYPSLKICGVENGFFAREEEGRICERINEACADVLFVCTGFPRQERFVRRNAPSLARVKLIMCLGGSLDVWAGKTLRAPIFIRKIHLEWLYRILHEPKRLERFLPSLCVFPIAAQKGAKKICGSVLSGKNEHIIK